MPDVRCTMDRRSWTSRGGRSSSGCSARWRPGRAAVPCGSAADVSGALLALLLLEPGRPVSVDTLTEELWAGAPPPGAAKSLRVYVSRLRSALAAAAVVARPPGYALEVDGDRIDATQFERLLRDGRDALGRGAAGLAGGTARGCARALARSGVRRRTRTRGCSRRRRSAWTSFASLRGRSRSRHSSLSVVTRSSSPSSSASSPSSRCASDSGGSS